MNRLANRVGVAILLGGALACAGCTSDRPPGDDPIRPGVDAAATNNSVRSINSDAQIEKIPTQPVDPSLDWPRLHGPTANGQSAEQNLARSWPESGPAELWRIPVGKGYSSPVIAAGKLIIQERIGETEQLRAINASDATPLWESGYLTNASNKTSYSNGPYSTPTVSDGVIFAASAEGTLRAIDLETGNVHWQRDLAGDFRPPPLFFSYGASPLVDTSRVYLNVGGDKTGAGVVCLDRQTGETVWTSTRYSPSYSSPVMGDFGGQKLLLVMLTEGLVCLEPDTGAERWFYRFGVELSAERANAVTPISYSPYVIIVAGPGPGIVCLEVPTTGQPVEKWKDRRLIDSQYTNLVLAHGKILGATSRRSALIRALDVKTGKKTWEWETDLCRANSLAAGPLVLFLGEHGHLGLIDVSSTEPMVLALTKSSVLATPCYSAPALAHGRLYIRNEQELACFDLRGQ